ncbi:PhoD-like phosphatase-domain-containing protein [Powellomyces hirtus]|nr:PhoD-like phosphatase-domain-containing protein [Powellomyces hirtus]
MAVVLLTTLAWIYSFAAGIHAFLAPILLKVIPSRQILRLIFLTYLFQVVLLPAVIYVWYSNDVARTQKRRDSVAHTQEETRALLAEGSSPRETVLMPERKTLGEFLLKRKLRTGIMVLALLANTVLFGLCMDFVFRPFLFAKHHDLEMTRVGGVGPSFAKIFLRSRRSAMVSLDYKRSGTSDKWATCETGLEVVPSNDYTAVGTCTNLSPNTLYQYRWKDSEGSSLLGDRDWENMHFTTAPATLEPTRYSFAFTSCVKPGFPYGTKGIRGFREMGKQDLSFVMFLGDLIYADAPHLYGTDVDTYRWHYRYLYSHADFKDTFRSLPFLTIYDDHEILNDWESDHQAPYPAAFKAFNEYAGLTNPHKDANQSAIFEYAYGDTAFFVMDTRGYRNFQEGTMLGAPQKARLKQWLLEVKHTATVKFLVTSVPFTQNWQWERRDTWAGYLKERQEILDFITTNDIRNVLAISGDRHEVAITRLPGNVIEFSTSPLQAFYSPIETYMETAEDQKIFSWRPGNIKWGMFTIDTKRKIPTATYALFVNDYQDTPVYEKTFELERIAKQ